MFPMATPIFASRFRTFRQLMPFMLSEMISILSIRALMVLSKPLTLPAVKAPEE